MAHTRDTSWGDDHTIPSNISWNNSDIPLHAYVTLTKKYHNSCLYSYLTFISFYSVGISGKLWESYCGIVSIWLYLSQLWQLWHPLGRHLLGFNNPPLMLPRLLLRPQRVDPISSSMLLFYLISLHYPLNPSFLLIFLEAEELNNLFLLHVLSYGMALILTRLDPMVGVSEEVRDYTDNNAWAIVLLLLPQELLRTTSSKLFMMIVYTTR